MLFDAEPVEACLVQPGVLRCRCPAHAPGIASLQVACDGFVVSDSVAFEYRRAPTTEPSPERALLDRSIGGRGISFARSRSTISRSSSRRATSGVLSSQYLDDVPPSRSIVGLGSPLERVLLFASGRCCPSLASRSGTSTIRWPNAVAFGRWFGLLQVSLRAPSLESGKS